jgi:hypothetical protein
VRRGGAGCQINACFDSWDGLLVCAGASLLRRLGRFDDHSKSAG